MFEHGSVSFEHVCLRMTGTCGNALHLPVVREQAELRRRLMLVCYEGGGYFAHT